MYLLLGLSLAACFYSSNVAFVWTFYLRPPATGRVVVAGAIWGETLLGGRKQAVWRGAPARTPFAAMAGTGLRGRSQDSAMSDDRRGSGAPNERHPKQRRENQRAGEGRGYLLSQFNQFVLDRNVQNLRIQAQQSQAGTRCRGARVPRLPR